MPQASSTTRFPVRSWIVNAGEQTGRRIKTDRLANSCPGRDSDLVPKRGELSANCQIKILFAIQHIRRPLMMKLTPNSERLEFRVSLACWTSLLLRKGLSDFQCNSRRVRV